MKTLIIGAGEIGNSLYGVLKQNYEVYLKDLEPLVIDGIEIMHICFPYSDKFSDAVSSYQKQYNPKYTVIHSTVPVGTSRSLNALHSPVVGLHPYLQESIKTFIKFLSGEGADKVADYFRRAGIKVYLVDKQETTELAKLSQTTFYALMIEYVKDLKLQCNKLGLPFSDVYTLFSQNYNEGYKKLGYPEYIMPLLIPIMKEQGGHCTIPNLKLWETKFTKFIEELNFNL